MHCFRKVTEDLYWVGASDRRLELFENIFPLSDGVSYNSYILMDEKSILFDSAASAVWPQFLQKCQSWRAVSAVAFLVVTSMRPTNWILPT